MFSETPCQAYGHTMHAVQKGHRHGRCGDAMSHRHLRSEGLGLPQLIVPTCAARLSTPSLSLDVAPAATH